MPYSWNVLEGVSNPMAYGLCSLICISSITLPRKLKPKPTSPRTCPFYLVVRSLTKLLTKLSFCKSMHVLSLLMDPNIMHTLPLQALCLMTALMQGAKKQVQYAWFDFFLASSQHRSHCCMSPKGPH